MEIEDESHQKNAVKDVAECQVTTVLAAADSKGCHKFRH